METYQKLFWGTGIPSGIVVFLISLLFVDPVIALTLGSISGVMFGGAMSLALGTVHAVGERQVVSKYEQQRGRNVSSFPSGRLRINDLQTGVHFIREIDVEAPYEEIFGICLEAARSLHKSSVQQDIDHGLIEAKTGTTFTSWGEEVLLNVTKLDEQNTRIKISSRPALRTTLADAGANRKNVEEITLWISSSFPDGSVARLDSADSGEGK
jgi:hypothetical protein